MLIVQNMLGIGQLWIISFYVPDVLLEVGSQVLAHLPTYERLQVLQVNR